ncbi:MAG: HDOD domain-containing protein [Bacteroidetes bacterium]|nr:HDOD domain-containing protein [Bacteroidota bacterium]
MTSVVLHDVHQQKNAILAAGVDYEHQVILQTIMNDVGERIGIVPNLQDVLIVGAKRKLDIIIIFLQGKSDSESVVLKNLRSLQPEACIVLLGSEELRGDAFEYIAAGYANRHLLLPLQYAEVVQEIHQIIKERYDFRYQNLQSSLSSFVNLPVPERFHTKLRTLLSQEGTPLQEIITEIEKNPALVAKVLRVANSVHYATRNPILTLREAIIFIGISYLETLVMAVDLFERFAVSRDPKIRASYEHLWNSSLRRALIAKKIAEESDLRTEASTIHIAALLQDIGMLARLCTTPDQYATMLQRKEEGTSLYIAELRTFLTTHDEIGAALLRRWNFPQEIVFAVANHHSETFGNDIVRCVQIADALDPVGENEPHDEDLYPDIAEWEQNLEPMLERLKEHAVP